jgi:uncharacterized protein (TIRG00374 family)
MRKLIIAIALLLGVVFVIGKLAEVQEIAETLERGDWRFIILALGVEVIWLLNIAAQYRYIFLALGLVERIEKLVLLSAAANFVNVVAPSAGMGGMAVFIAEARREGYSAARVTVAGMLFVLFDYVGFLFILALGLIVLLRRDSLGSEELVPSAILVVIASVLATVIFLGMRSASALGRVLAGMARFVNWILKPFLHREYLSEQRAHTFAQDVAGGLHELRYRLGDLFLPLALAVSSKALLIVVLLLLFLAFKVPFSIGTLIGGFSIGYLFLIVSPTPAGIGVVEGALTLALSSLRVPLGAAAVLALAYRGITFWIPMLFGLLAFRYLSRSDKIRVPALARPQAGARADASPARVDEELIE